jgi:protocatechuate 3,4-dioxygenase beta subunit
MLTQATRFSVTAAALAALLAAQPVFAAGPVLAQAESSSSGVAKKSKMVDLWQPGDSGQRMNISGLVTSIDGTPLAGIPISIRQANGDGDYTDRYRTTLLSDAQGRYQFGTVLPANYSGARHVHVTVYEDGYEYFDTSILFKRDPNLTEHYGDGTPIFLEESTVKGETILFGRFDIVLVPE